MISYLDSFTHRPQCIALFPLAILYKSPFIISTLLYILSWCTPPLSVFIPCHVTSGSLDAFLQIGGHIQSSVCYFFISVDELAHLPSQSKPFSYCLLEHYILLILLLHWLFLLSLYVDFFSCFHSFSGLTLCLFSCLFSLCLLSCCQDFFKPCKLISRFEFQVNFCFSLSFCIQLPTWHLHVNV